MHRLTLLGTIHRDPQGLIKLVQALNGLKPDVITLEFSLYGLRYRSKKKRSLSRCLLRGLQEIGGTNGLHLGALKKLMRTSGIGGIGALLDLPFEYKGASFYSKHHSIPLHCVDISLYSRQLLSKLDELLSPENLKKVLAFETTPLQAAVIEECKRAERLLPNSRHLITLDRVWEKRERIMASRIRKIVARYRGGHLVHIGGWQHLTAQPATLFSCLVDLTPERVLLGSTDPHRSSRFSET
jgi:hypothetical protein